MLRKLLTLLAVALLMPTLGGCFLFSSPPPLDPPALPSIVPRECQRILRKVPDPGAKVGDDLGDIAAKYRGAYLKANNRIGAGAACENHQADAIERGGGK